LGDSCNGCGALLCRDAIIQLGGWNPDYYPASDRILFMLYANKFGLYRINEIVRKETFVISTSNALYQQYPSVSFYLSRALILKAFFLKPIWNFFNYHSYVVYSNSRSQWEDKNVEKKVPIISKIIDKIYKLPYRVLGDKRLCLGNKE
jgi:hypothetical protein